MMRLLLIIPLFLVFGVQAQDSIRYDTLITKAEGDKQKYKYRSSATNTRQVAYLRKGKWLFFGTDGTLLKEVNYKVATSKEESTKHGIEVYYDPEIGDTILVREFKKGHLTNQYAYKPAVLVEKFFTLNVYKDFSSFSVAQYKNKNAFPQGADFVSLWKSTLEDPDQITSMENYVEYEDSLGDPSLMEPPNFGSLSQYNHVGNPEFEFHPKAPFSIMSFTDQVKDWSLASESPDFYLSPGNAHSGTAFIGFRVFSMQKHIEYVQNKLRKPLIKDSIYCFSAYIKLSPGSKYATNAFGVLFSDRPVYINTDELLTIKPSIELDNQLLSFKTRWMKIQCTYKAQGGERYLIIGSFKDHERLSLVEVPGTIRECYYYLDDVALVPIKDESECNCNFSDQRPDPKIVSYIETNEELENMLKLKVGESIILEKILFENDKDDLLPESYASLMNLLKYLNQNTSATVEISGHTSSPGELEHNIDLSNRRAEAVKKFLTLNGIDQSRIITIGHGPNKPISDNETEKGQRLNRRVEFRILSI